MKNSIQFMVFLITVILFAFSCNDSGVNPEDNLKPGRRDYVWEIDTLNNQDEYIGYFEMWGANSNNVWIVGEGTNNTESILHYDGSTWKVANEGQYIRCNSIFGTSENNIWIGGDEGKIYHYNGNEIRLFQTIEQEGFNYFGFYSIDGSLPNNIVAVGALDWETGAIARFNGNTWRIEYIADFPSQFIDVLIDPNSINHFYICSVLYNSEFDVAMYKYADHEMIRIQNGRFSENSVPVADKLGNEIFFFWGGKMFSYFNNEFNLFLDLSYLGNSISRIWGRNRKDFFLTQNNKLYHYNGTDLQNLLTTDQNDLLDIRDAVLFENEIFFLVLNHHTSQRFVIKGKINNL